MELCTVSYAGFLTLGVPYVVLIARENLWKLSKT
jgi:hypothetical protein